ncbi:MAG: DUF456 domain-containing protein [Bacteroidaceae bacterium]|nr:DUF456 domain-containing protein [Bacteroidaceae bacterium]
METLLIILALVFGIVGLAGSILPALPGAPLSYIGLLLLLLCDGADISSASLWTGGIFLVIVSVLDYIAPIWLTNASGGSKQATRGSVIGMVAGLFFFPPWGLILGPFIGAFLGELMAQATTGKALKVAMMSFLGFVLTTGMKLIYSGVLLFMIVKECIKLIF